MRRAIHARAPKRGGWLALGLVLSLACGEDDELGAELVDMGGAPGSTDSGSVDAGSGSVDAGSGSVDAGSSADTGAGSGSADAGSSADTGAGTGDAGTGSPFQELFDQGVDQYLGRFMPSMVEDLGGGVTSYTFSDADRGPTCFTGETFRMATREGSSDDLMIFLQGGGACGPNGCDAVETAMAGIPAFGVLSPRDPRNPTANYDVGYLPYCDGSLWGGDLDRDSDGDGVEDRLFRGLQNLSASLDVIARQYPSPRRIFLTGNSAGGFGTHMALPLVRKLYPGVTIEFINDSGVGIQSPGSQESLNAYWNTGRFFPASCTECIGADGNLTDYHAWQLTEDPNLRMGFMSYTQDGVVLERSPLDGPTYEAELLEAMGELRTAFPQRFQSFIVNGDGHTFILRDFELVVGSTSVRAWIEAMLDGGNTWVSVIDESP